MVHVAVSTKAQGVHTTTKIEGKDINRPAQTTKTCHASFPLIKKLVEARIRGEVLPPRPRRLRFQASPLHSPAHRSFRRVSPVRPDKASSTVRCKRRCWLAVSGTSPIFRQFAFALVHAGLTSSPRLLLREIEAHPQSVRQCAVALVHAGPLSPPPRRSLLAHFLLRDALRAIAVPIPPASHPFS